MFRELAPYLRHRSVLMTVTHLGEDDQIRVNIIPQKLKDGENEALTTPVSITGTSEELDADLPKTLIDYVSAHLHLKNSLDSAKATMDAVAKAAQDEARTKAKTASKAAKPQATVAQGTTTASETAKPIEIAPSTPKSLGLFDVAEPAPPAASAGHVTEEDEILSEINGAGDADSGDLEDA